MKAKKKSSLAGILLKEVSHNKASNRLAQSGLSFYQSSGLQKTARFFKLPKLLKLDKVERLLPTHSDRTPLKQNTLLQSLQLREMWAYLLAVWVHCWIMSLSILRSKS